MNSTFYKTFRLASRFVKSQCIREVVLHPERVDRSGGFILACTHLSHLEPVVVGSIVQRTIRWMARVEFYGSWWASMLLRQHGTIPVDRFGFSLPAVRCAIRLARGGEVVGIFPEGGVAKGPGSVVRGGSIKQGVCTISIRSGVPVVPVVVLGTDRLNRVRPWVPPHRGRIWVAFGRDVAPPARRTTNRRDRAEMSDRLRAEFRSTYEELLAGTGLRDSEFP